MRLPWAPVQNDVQTHSTAASQTLVVVETPISAENIQVFGGKTREQYFKLNPNIWAKTHSTATQQTLVVAQGSISAKK